MESNYISLAIEKVINYFGSKNVQLTETEIREKAIISDEDDKILIAFLKNSISKIDKVAYGKKCLLFDNANLSLGKYFIQFAYSYEELSRPETTEEELTKIMDKIQKLLAVTQDNGASENEAIIAATKAQNLMKQYDLDYASLRGNKKEEILNVEYMTNVSCHWQYQLAFEVAHAYCCHSMYSVCGRCGSIIKFRGYKSDVIIARRMYAYLHETALRLGRKYDREHKGYGKSKLTMYCKGFVMGVSAALQENCRKLALVMPKEVESEWQEYSKNMGTVRRERQNYIDRAAVMNGMSDGKQAIHGTYVESKNSMLESKS